MRAPKGLVYTILADGKPIVVLEASGREAAELCREEWFAPTCAGWPPTAKLSAKLNQNYKRGRLRKTRGSNTWKDQKKQRSLMTSCLYI